MEPFGPAAQPSDRPTVDPFLTISGAHERSRAARNEHEMPANLP